MKSKFLTWHRNKCTVPQVLGYIDYKAERSQNTDGTWSFNISDNDQTFLHVDNWKYPERKDLDVAIRRWLDEEEIRIYNKDNGTSLYKVYK